jgi:hypothetical protein
LARFLSGTGQGPKNDRATKGNNTVLLRKFYRATKEMCSAVYLQISVFYTKWSIACFTVVCLYGFVVEQQGGKDLGSS